MRTVRGLRLRHELAITLLRDVRGLRRLGLQGQIVEGLRLGGQKTAQVLLQGRSASEGEGDAREFRMQAQAGQLLPLRGASLVGGDGEPSEEVRGRVGGRGGVSEGFGGE